MITTHKKKNHDSVIASLQILGLNNKVFHCFLFQTSPLKDSIKIGEYLTILVYLKDVRNQFNLMIHDCWAYDNDEYDSPKTNKIQLTDKEGCPK